MPGYPGEMPGNPVRPHRRGTGGKLAEKFFYGGALWVIARGTVDEQYPDSFGVVHPGEPPGPGREERGNGEIRPKVAKRAYSPHLLSRDDASTGWGSPPSSRRGDEESGEIGSETASLALWKPLGWSKAGHRQHRG